MTNFTIETLTKSIDNSEQFNVYNTAFEGFNVLTFKHCGSNELFFIGSQCVKMLGYANATQTFNTHISDENKCNLDYDHCTMLMDLISNEINGLGRPIDSIGLTQDGAKSLISNEINSNEINELGRTIDLNQSREGSSKLLNSKENNGRFKFNPKGATFISELGLYSLILRSNKPKALKFQDTVHRILKEIRQTGGYGLDKVNNNDSTLNTLNAMSQSMNVMSTTLQSRLNVDNIVNNVVDNRFTQTIGSYSHSIGKLPLLNDNNKSRNPAKKWTNQTSVYNMLGSLATYINSQYVKLCELSGKIKMLSDKFIKTEADNIITEHSVADLEAKVDKTAADLNYKVLSLQQQVNQSLVTNIDSLKLKIESLEEKLDDVII